MFMAEAHLAIPTDLINRHSTKFRNFKDKHDWTLGYIPRLELNSKSRELSEGVWYPVQLNPNVLYVVTEATATEVFSPHEKEYRFE